MYNTRISAIILTFNEENTISRCIESISEIVDEIIIIDTGSTDNTINIARKYTKNVIIHLKEWGNDFSEMRNLGISLAKNNWCFMIDADEYLDEKSQSGFRTVINNIDISHCDGIYAPIIDNLNGSILTNNARIFKKSSFLKYDGMVHEYLIGNTGGIISTPEIKINHTGYICTPSKLKDKLDRNKKLLRKQIKLDPNGIRWKYFYLRYIEENDLDHMLTLDFFGKLDLPYSCDIEVFALNVKTMLINKKLREGDFKDAFFHSSQLYSHYKDKSTTFNYLMCKYYLSKEIFTEAVVDVKNIYSEISVLNEDEFLYEKPDENTVCAFLGDFSKYEIFFNI